MSKKDEAAEAIIKELQIYLFKKNCENSAQKIIQESFNFILTKLAIFQTTLAEMEERLRRK